MIEWRRGGNKQSLRAIPLARPEDTAALPRLRNRQALAEVFDPEWLRRH